MSVNLPNPGQFNIPDVPKRIADKDPELADYFKSIKRAVERGINGQFENCNAIAVALNSGTSGTFTLSSGGSIIITSGVVITVTS